MINLNWFSIHFTDYIKLAIIYECGRNNCMLYGKKSDFSSLELLLWYNILFQCRFVEYILINNIENVE